MSEQKGPASLKPSEDEKALAQKTALERLMELINKLLSRTGHNNEKE